MLLYLSVVVQSGAIMGAVAIFTTFRPPPPPAAISIISIQEECVVPMLCTSGNYLSMAKAGGREATVSRSSSSSSIGCTYCSGDSSREPEKNSDIQSSSDSHDVFFRRSFVLLVFCCLLRSHLPPPLTASSHYSSGLPCCRFLSQRPRHTGI